jgi:hypothetical protein
LLARDGVQGARPRVLLNLERTPALTKWPQP